MNALADEHGFIAVYPAQSTKANAQKCWSWFRTEDQRRECGEPAIIAGITRQVAATYRVDSRRMFVVGMSAGAAMAVVLATTYPDLYAAVGAHSGLAYRAAHDVPSAFKAMHAPGSLPAPGRAGHHPDDRISRRQGSDGRRRQRCAIVGHAVASRARSALREDASAGVAGGRRFTRKVYADAGNDVVAEHWVVHGAGHAWSGGSRRERSRTQAGPTHPGKSSGSSSHCGAQALHDIAAGGCCLHARRLFPTRYRWWPRRVGSPRPRDKLRFLHCCFEGSTCPTPRSPTSHLTATDAIALLTADHKNP